MSRGKVSGQMTSSHTGGFRAFRERTVAAAAGRLRSELWHPDKPPPLSEPQASQRGPRLPTLTFAVISNFHKHKGHRLANLLTHQIFSFDPQKL